VLDRRSVYLVGVSVGFVGVGTGDSELIQVIVTVQYMWNLHKWIHRKAVDKLRNRNMMGIVRKQPSGSRNSATSG
jgi:hypothetical protein